MPITFAGRLALAQRWADPLGERLQPLIHKAVDARPVRNALDGVWLGAPLHPALTDVPVGAWTAALAMDSAGALTGDRALDAAADRVLAVGTLAALPAAATGLNDLRDLLGQSRRVATVHAVLNVIGLSLTGASLVYRRAGRRGRARALSGAGYLVSASAAHLGGKLSFGLGIRVNRTMGQFAPDSFVRVLDAADLGADEMRRVDVGGVAVLVARSRAGRVCALAETCTHLGAPLSEGDRDGDVVTCPWHGSRFDLSTGAVLQGPAVFAQPRLEARERDGAIEVGVPAAPGAELTELATFAPPTAGSDG